MVVEDYFVYASFGVMDLRLDDRCTSFAEKVYIHIKIGWVYAGFEGERGIYK